MRVDARVRSASGGGGIERQRRRGNDAHGVAGKDADRTGAARGCRRRQEGSQRRAAARSRRARRGGGPRRGARPAVRSDRRRPAPDRRPGCRTPPASRRAPGAAWAASRPPLMAENSLRMAFITRDRRARGEKRAVDRLLVLERQTSRRGRQQRRAAARDQRDDEVVRAEPGDARHQPTRREVARKIGHRMGGFDDFDAIGSERRSRSG